MEKRPEAKPNSLEPAQDAATTWRYFAPAGVTLEMVQRPDYWKNAVRELGQQRVPGRHAWNKIEVISEDGTWEAELRVTSVAQGLVVTRLLREWAAPVRAGRKPNLPDGYVVEHIPSNGWRALAPGGDLVATNQTIEADAIRAAYDHSKKAAA